MQGKNQRELYTEKNVERIEETDNEKIPLLASYE